MVGGIVERLLLGGGDDAGGAVDGMGGAGGGEGAAGGVEGVEGDLVIVFMAGDEMAIIGE